MTLHQKTQRSVQNTSTSVNDFYQGQNLRKPTNYLIRTKVLLFVILFIYDITLQSIITNHLCHDQLQKCSSSNSSHACKSGPYYTHHNNNRLQIRPLIHDKEIESRHATATIQLMTSYTSFIFNRTSPLHSNPNLTSKTGNE